MVHDLAARKALAASYIALMEKDIEPPVCSGLKNSIAPEQNSNFANAVTYCRSFVERQHHYRKRTVCQYTSRINIFANWLHGAKLHNITLGQINATHAANFLHYLRTERKASGKTYNDYKSLFAEIWRGAMAEQLIRYNPWQHIKSVPENTKHLSSLPEQVRTLIAATLPEHDAQLWLFIQFVFYGALRPHAELRLLQVKHINFADGSVHVPAHISKTKVSRAVHLYTGLMEQINHWQTLPPDYFLFGKDGAPGAERTRINNFQRKCIAYKKHYGIATEYKIYGCKHTAGKQLSAMFNEYITRQHFGHKSAKSTSHYTDGLPNEQLKFLHTSYPEF
jgi:site-specific recombinase XerC